MLQTQKYIAIIINLRNYVFVEAKRRKEKKYILQSLLYLSFLFSISGFNLTLWIPVTIYFN